MINNNASVALSLDGICRFLHDQAGIIVLNHQMENLARFLEKNPALTHASNFQQYLRQLQSSEYSQEFMDLIAAVTVGESYFFRWSAQMEFLQTVWLPELIARRERSHSRYLRIWSAGCSSGQEIYSIAILLRELIPDIANWEIYLLGTDINRLAINDAKNGCYSEWAFRMTNPFIKQKYFTKIDRGYQINSDIKKMVDFHYHNLMHDDYPSQETETVGLDLILCRNVFIYFDPTVAMQIGERFKECLVLGGALLLGPSDFFTKNPIDLIHKRYGEIGYFEKKTTKETVQKVATGKLAVKRKILSVLRARPADAPKRSIVAPNKVTIAAGQKPEDILAQLDMLILDERWSEVLEAVSKLLEKKPDNALLWRYKTESLANLGRKEEAFEACHKSLELNKIDPKTHWLEAMIELDCGNTVASEKALKQALFLDPNFVEAQYWLALSLFHRNEHEKGLKNIQVALDKVEKGKVSLVNRMSVDEFASILREEIKAHRAKTT